MPGTQKPSGAAAPFITCTVRECGSHLNRGEGAWTCERGHHFNVARSGYVNLLQPQDRRSLASGDSASAVAARGRLLEAGVGRAILEAFVGRAVETLVGEWRQIVELGCGSGDVLAGVALRRPIRGVGLDLSTSAADRAARRFPSLTWVVANADRRLPLDAHSVDLVLSFNGRRNPADCARVLRPRGRVLVAVPGADDLLELREMVQGRRQTRDRIPALIEEYREHFDVVGRASAREQHRLGPAALQDLLLGTYRGERRSVAARAARLDAEDVTLASEFVVFARRGDSAG